MRLTGLSVIEISVSTWVSEMSNLSRRATIPIEKSIQLTNPAPTSSIGDSSSPLPPLEEQAEATVFPCVACNVVQCCIPS
ncbi:MAG: hypothetical protein AB4040_11265 [Synechococcus sp.]